VSKLIVIKLHQKSVYKNKDKRHKAFDAEVNDSNDDEFFFKFEKKKKFSNEITALFKKIVSKMFKFK